MVEIRPQKGAQEKFLSTSADIAIYGGAAGGGKSWGLLLEPLRHINNPQFNGVIFRRTTKQVRNPGGLWDESSNLYPLLEAEGSGSSLEWKFHSGALLKFGHMEHEKNRYDWQGAQITFIGFDELTHFTKLQFMYMLSRNRSVSGIKPYIRATTNPDSDSWVAEFISWWIDKDTGYPIHERSGVLRWFIREGDNIIWADSREELIADYPNAEPKSFTFIAASVFDNKILMQKDPGYLANLKALPRVERERLLGGNWKVRPAAGLYFRREMFPIVEAAPIDSVSVRCWDLAGTAKTEDNNPDWTAGVKMSRDSKGRFYIEHISRFQKSPHEVEKAIKNTATHDSEKTVIVIQEDPGQAGKFEVHYYIRELAGFSVYADKITKSKITLASPFSAQCEAGNVSVVRGAWNEDFFSELESFPEGSHDDQVDAASGAFKKLISMKQIIIV
jgi:predicted phage terminase large subunit-like protein